MATLLCIDVGKNLLFLCHLHVIYIYKVYNEHHLHTLEIGRIFKDYVSFG